MNDEKKRQAIDRPCSACSAGDHEMRYHKHSPPFREGSQPAPDPPPAEPPKTTKCSACDGRGEVYRKHEKCWDMCLGCGGRGYVLAGSRPSAPAPSGEPPEEHPYHEACPKCLHTKKLLQKRLKRFEDSMEGLRQAMGISAVYYDTPEKIADAAKTRLLHWLEQSQSSPVDLQDAAREALVRLECVNRILGDPAADSLDHTTKTLNDVAIRRLRSALAAVREGK